MEVCQKTYTLQTSPFLGEHFWTDIIICTFLSQGHTERIGQSKADTEDTCRESVADGEDETASRTPGRWSIGKAPLPNLLDPKKVCCAVFINTF